MVELERGVPGGAVGGGFVGEEDGWDVAFPISGFAVTQYAEGGSEPSVESLNTSVRFGVVASSLDLADAECGAH